MVDEILKTYLPWFCATLYIVSRRAYNWVPIFFGSCTKEENVAGIHRVLIIVALGKTHNLNERTYERRIPKR